MATHTFTPTAEDTEAEAEAEAVGFLYSSQPGRATGRDPVSHKNKTKYPNKATGKQNEGADFEQESQVDWVGNLTHPLALF